MADVTQRFCRQLAQLLECRMQLIFRPSVQVAATATIRKILSRILRVDIWNIDSPNKKGISRKNGLLSAFILLMVDVITHMRFGMKRCYIAAS